MPPSIQPGPTFKENLALLPSIDGIDRIDLTDVDSAIVATIENQPGKKGSLAVYQYLKQIHHVLDAQAAELGLAIFAEHTTDARSNPGAHPNVDRLLDVAAGAAPLGITVVPVEG